MRILFCNYEYPPLGGGGGVVNAALARELAKRHDVTVLTSQGLGLPREAIVGEVRVIRAPVFFRRHHAVANFPSMMAYLVTGTQIGRSLLRRERFDLINTHFALPTGPVGDWLSRAAKVPNVLSVHGGDLYDPSKWMSAHRHAVLRASVRRLALRADALVAQSSDTLENLRRFYAPEADAHVIPLGIEPPPHVDCSRAKYGISQDDVLLISVGRLIDRKRIDQLIKTVAELDDRRVQLLLVGEGPRAHELRALARRIGVESQVRFFGAVDEVAKYELLTMADLYVSTSEHEGFGLVFLEAMASGLPIVCYACGGQSDFLSDGTTGHLTPLNDRASFTESCRRLIADSARRRAIGAGNRHRVSDFYIERCARRYEEVFETVIRERTRYAAGKRVSNMAKDQRFVGGAK